MIEVTCPHCSKQMQITEEELTISGGYVVCPQCLSETALDGIVDASLLQTIRAKHRVGKSVSAASFHAPSSPTAAPAATLPFNFCPNCGKHLPAPGMNFCPYCGLNLTGTSAPAQPTHIVDIQTVATQTVATPASAAEAMQEGDLRAMSVPQTDTGEQKGALRFRPYTFTPSLRHHHRDEPAGPVFKAVSGLIIALLVTFLVYMIYLFIADNANRNTQTLAVINETTQLLSTLT